MSAVKRLFCVKHEDMINDENPECEKCKREGLPPKYDFCWSYKCEPAGKGKQYRVTDKPEVYPSACDFCKAYCKLKEG